MNISPAPRKRGRPKKSEAPALSIEQLLDASADIFARDGYDGVSLRKLQDELNVSYTFFHHYFSSKEQLWQAVVDRLCGATTAKVLEALQHIDDDHNELDALKEGIAVYIRSAFEHPALYHICQQESLREGPRLSYIHKHYFEPAWQLISDMVAKVDDVGIIKDIPIETLFFVVQSATAPVVQLPFYQRLTGKTQLDPEFVETHIQQSIDLLFHGWHK
ncbi:TetR/AcrR family transcriptional regulator [Zhongshania sp.]|jgi:AcrR family transcriptional regulator|uniref:TetR/AcrR family transcriptional regulator n=1 Tax=Zhongshania sp. TaxID=1971902 RepID=UPI001B6C5778|nr:TetR/AcrR family transcriptional regulator [Zhongshania sp.]MBQ0797083.1 TetR/AcrR family transcriptional regulator [Zhongshania sp.]